MCGHQYYVAKLVELSIQSILYGIYVLMFGANIYIHVWRRTNKWLFTASSVLFVSTTGMTAIDALKVILSPKITTTTECINGLIAWRVWWMSQGIDNVLGKGTGSPHRLVISLALESGALICAGSVISLCMRLLLPYFGGYENRSGVAAGISFVIYCITPIDEGLNGSVSGTWKVGIGDSGVKMSRL